MDGAIGSAWNWLLVDAWGISLLTVVACVLVVGAMMAAGYVLLGFLAGVVHRVRKASGAGNEPGSTGEWRRSPSG